MRLKLEIELDNAAFEDDVEEEVLRILSTVRVRDGQILRDINGNKVGKVELDGQGD